MFKILIKKFVGKNKREVEENRGKLIFLTGLMGLIINILLFILKITIGFLMNSVSVIGDAFNNLSDMLSSIISIFGSIISSKPADEHHPYGHGRMEYLASLVVGISVIIVGSQLLKSSVESIINPRQIEVNSLNLLILLISIGFKIYMYFYNKKADKIIKSPLNRAAAIDSRNDVFATGLVILSVVVYKYFDLNLDGLAGLFISVLVIKSGIEVFVDMGDVLLGKEIPEETIRHVEEILLSGNFIRGVHDIEIHDYGNGNLFGNADVEVPANIDAFSIHEVIDGLEKRIKKELKIKISIHLDPSYCLEEDHFIKQNCRSGNYESIAKKLNENKK